MTFRNGSGVAAWSACSLGLLVSCSGSYTPELELWPATADASSTITAFTGYDATSVADAAASAATIDDSGGITLFIETGSPARRSVAEASSPDSEASGGSQMLDAAPAATAPAHQAPDAGPPRPHALTVVVTTVDDGQGYSPANVGAIWVAQSSGAFVKTLQVWAKTRIDHLVLWNSVTKAAGLSRNTVDAITGASAYAFGTHVVYWNFTDTSEKVVPDGTYRVYFETTDFNVTGPNTYVEFTKGPSAATLTFPDTPSFTDLKLVYSP
jgi:hypothetical protein